MKEKFSIEKNISFMRNHNLGKIFGISFTVFWPSKVTDPTLEDNLNFHELCFLYKLTIFFKTSILLNLSITKSPNTHTNPF